MKRVSGSGSVGAFGLFGAAPFSGGEQLGAVLVGDRHERRSPVVVRPAVGSLHGGAWHRGRLDDAEREIDDRSLVVGVEGAARRVAERVVDEEEAGDPALLDDVTGRTDDDGGDSGGFEATCDQTHGLVTDRSKWDEQRDVDTVVVGPGGDLVGVEAGLALAVFGGDAVEALVE